MKKNLEEESEVLKFLKLLVNDIHGILHRNKTKEWTMVPTKILKKESCAMNLHSA